MPENQSVSDVLTTLIAGLGTGAVYALFVLGIVLIYQVSKQVSFAYGQTGMVGALCAWWLFAEASVQIAFALLLGVVLSMIVAAATEIGIVRHVSTIRPGFDLIVTLGMFLVLTAIAEELVGSEARPFMSDLADNVVTVGDVYVNVADLVVTLGVGLLLLGVYLVLQRTGLGVSLRAAAEDADTARALGIDVARLRTAVWLLSGVISAVAAVIFASRLFVDTNYMIPVLINGLVAAIVGGLDRFWSPIFVAVGLGVYEAMVGLYFGATASVPAVFVVLILILTLAPRGWVSDQVARP